MVVVRVVVLDRCDYIRTKCVPAKCCGGGCVRSGGSGGGGGGRVSLSRTLAATAACRLCCMFVVSFDMKGDLSFCDERAQVRMDGRDVGKVGRCGRVKNKTTSAVLNIAFAQCA